MKDERMAPKLGNGKICYIEIPTDNKERSAAFYLRVFGWRMRTRDDGAVAFDDGVGEVSGAFVIGRPAGGMIGVLVYIMVDDAETTLQAIRDAGGSVVQPIGTHHPEITARFSDPFGKVLGIYQEPN
jgi:predicted enzyme related to lactoylglutathione lyase